MNKESANAKYLLDAWANWLMSGSGWNHRSPTDRVADQVGIGRGGFQSTIPIGVEPSMPARMASLAMQELRELDGRSALVIEAIYLRSGKNRAVLAARSLGITVSVLKSRQKRAETVFYGLVLSRNPTGQG